MEQESLFTLGDVLPEVRENIRNRLDEAPPTLFNSLLRRTTLSLAHSTIHDFEESSFYKQYLALEDEEIETEIEFDHVYKVIMVGAHSVGKSSVARRLESGQFEPKPVEITVGPEFFRKTVVVRMRAIKAQIWDTAGQERFGAITRGYFRNALAAVLVYEITDKDSFKALDHWLAQVRDWAPDATLCLIGNKSDLNSRRKVTTEEGGRYAKENGIEIFYETSAANGSNVKDTFCDLMTAVYEKLKAQGGDEYRYEESRIAIDDISEDLEPGGCLC